MELSVMNIENSVDVVSEPVTNIETIAPELDIKNIDRSLAAESVFVESINFEVVISTDNLRAESKFQDDIKFNVILS